MVPLHLGGSESSLGTKVIFSVPGMQPLKVHGPTGKEIGSIHQALFQVLSYHSQGWQNLTYQRYRIVCSVFQSQSQGPSFPSPHSFPESIQAFRNKSVRGVVFE